MGNRGRAPVGRYIAVRITAIYALVSGLWILLSDTLLDMLLPPDLFGRLSILKGLGFVSITALLLHTLIRNSTAALRDSESAALDSERRLSDIIAFLPDPTLVVGRDGRVIAWNRAMEEATGVPADHMVGKGDYEYAVPFYGFRRPMLVDVAMHPDLEIAESYRLDAREGRTLMAEVFVPSFRGKGTYFWVKASPLYDSYGNLVGAVEVVRDVTRQKAAEEERLRVAERERQIQAEADEAKRLFYQKTIFAVTGGKLNLVEHGEIDALMGDQADSMPLRSAEDLSDAREKVILLGQQVGMDVDRIHSLVTAVGEAAANAVKHAEGGLVRTRLYNEALLVCVQDRGSGIDSLTLPNATLLARFSTKTSMGLGYSLILGLVDSVFLASDSQGTSILMEQGIVEPQREISLEALPDTW